MNGLFDLIASGAITREEYEKRVYHYKMMEQVKTIAEKKKTHQVIFGTEIDGSGEVATTCTCSSFSEGSKRISLSMEVRKYLSEMPPGVINLPDEEGNTLFLWVCQVSETCAMRMLIEIPGIHGTWHNARGQHALLFASVAGFETLVMKLLQYYPYESFSPTSTIYLRRSLMDHLWANTLEGICYHVMKNVLHKLMHDHKVLHFHGDGDGHGDSTQRKTAFMWILLRGGERMSRKLIQEVYAYPSFGEGITREACTTYLQEMLLVEYSRGLVEPLLLHYPANLLAPILVSDDESESRTLFDAVCERFPDLAPACIHLHGIPANTYHPKLDEDLYETVEAECSVCMETERGHFITCGNARCGKTVHVKCWKEFVLSQQVRYQLDDRSPHQIDRVQCVCCRDSSTMFFVIPS